MRYRAPVALVVAILLITTAYTGLGAFESFPIYAIDSNGDPVTGLSIRCAVQGSSPPTWVGNPAIEEGGGAYYFKVGTLDTTEVPSGYYDVYRDAVLSASWTKAYIGLGNVPPANSIDSTHVKNPGIAFSGDIRQTYGSPGTEIGQVYQWDIETSSSSAGTREVIEIDVTNHVSASGAAASARVIPLTIRHMANDLDDSYAQSGGLAIEVDANPTNVLQTARAGQGTWGSYTRILLENMGAGHITDVRTTDNSIGTMNWGYGLAGTRTYVEADDADGKVSSVAGHETLLYAEDGTIATATGHSVKVYSDTSVTTSYGTIANNHSADGTWPVNSYGGHFTAKAQDKTIGVYASGWCTEANCDAYGAQFYAWEDTTKGGGRRKGIHAEAITRWPMTSNQAGDLAYGGYFLAGADTAYGIYAAAASDEDNASNRTYGGYFSAVNAPKNYAVYGIALRADNDIENYGIYGKASGGGQGNWSGYFEAPGHVMIDTLRMPETATVPGYPIQMAIETTGANGVGLYSHAGGNGATAIWVNGTGTGTQYGIYATMGGLDYAVYVNSGLAYLCDTEVSGTLEAGATSVSSLMLPGVSATTSTRVWDIATIPSGEDSVLVQGTAFTVGDSTDYCVVLTALGRCPDGTYCAAGFGFGSTDEFTIYTSSNQTADQKFYWLIVEDR